MIDYMIIVEDKDQIEEKQEEETGKTAQTTIHVF
jgi:hypothetical protein